MKTISATGDNPKIENSSRTARTPTKVLLSLLIFSICASAHAAPVKYTEVRLTQFYGGSGWVPAHETPEKFTPTVEQVCATTNTRAALAPAAILAGIIVDWLAGRLIKAANARLEKYLKEHTASYENKPSFHDILSNTGGVNRWSQDNGKGAISCVVVQRLECDIDSDKLADPFARCDAGTRPSASIAIVMRNYGDHLRAYPLALSITSLKARHSKGDASIAAALEIHGISSQPEGGQRWTTGSVPLIAETFPAQKAKSKGGYATADYHKGYFLLPENAPGASDLEKVLESPLWDAAAILPSPPKLDKPAPAHTLAAIQIHAAEVGEPGGFAKNLANLVSTKEGDLSGALGAAIKKKLDIKTD
jgi:hypothetical protein